MDDEESPRAHGRALLLSRACEHLAGPGVPDVDASFSADAITLNGMTTLELLHDRPGREAVGQWRPRLPSDALTIA
jgi:hypothetical protein